MTEYQSKSVDTIVVGAGHAGIEAALAAENTAGGVVFHGISPK